MFELIYTSVQKGLLLGRSGFTTVAMTEGFPVNLIPLLENLSAYQAIYPPKDANEAQNPVNCTFSLKRFGAMEYGILSRISYADVSYTGRCNNLAYHLLIPPDELKKAPYSPVQLLQAEENFCWDGTIRYLPVAKKLTWKAPASKEGMSWERALGDSRWARVIAEIFRTQAKPISIQFNPLIHSSAEILQLIAEVSAWLTPQEQRLFSFSTYCYQSNIGNPVFLRAYPENSTYLGSIKRLSPESVLILGEPRSIPHAYESLFPQAQSIPQTSVPQGERSTVIDTITLPEKNAPADTDKLASPLSQSPQTPAIPLQNLQTRAPKSTPIDRSKIQKSSGSSFPTASVSPSDSSSHNHRWILLCVFCLVFLAGILFGSLAFSHSSSPEQEETVANSPARESENRSEEKLSNQEEKETKPETSSQANAPSAPSSNAGTRSEAKEPPAPLIPPAPPAPPLSDNEKINRFILNVEAKKLSPNSPRASILKALPPNWLKLANEDYGTLSIAPGQSNNQKICVYHPSEYVKACWKMELISIDILEGNNKTSISPQISSMQIDSICWNDREIICNSVLSKGIDKPINDYNSQIKNWKRKKEQLRDDLNAKINAFNGKLQKTLSENSSPNGRAIDEIHELYSKYIKDLQKLNFSEPPALLQNFKTFLEKTDAFNAQLKEYLQNTLDTSRKHSPGKKQKNTIENKLNLKHFSFKENKMNKEGPQLEFQFSCSKEHSSNKCDCSCWLCLKEKADCLLNKEVDNFTKKQKDFIEKQEKILEENPSIQKLLASKDEKPPEETTALKQDTLEIDKAIKGFNKEIPYTTKITDDDKDVLYETCLQTIQVVITEKNPKSPKQQNN